MTAFLVFFFLTLLLFAVFRIILLLLFIIWQSGGLVLFRIIIRILFYTIIFVKFFHLAVGDAQQVAQASRRAGHQSLVGLHRLLAGEASVHRHHAVVGHQEVRLGVDALQKVGQLGEAVAVV